MRSSRLPNTFFLLFLLLFFFIGPVSAFEDSVQRYNIDFEEVWDYTDSIDGYWSHSNGPSWTYSDITTENRPIAYSTSKALKFFVDAQGRYEAASHTATAQIISKEMMSIDYFAFTVHDASVSGGTLSLKYYDESMNLLASTNLGITTKSVGYSDRYELVRSNMDILLYKNGVYVSTTSLSSNEYAYVAFYAYAYGNDIGSKRQVLTAYVDDISTTSILGLNEAWIQANTFIDISYGIQSQSSFPDDEYKIVVNQLSTSDTINTTSLGTGTTGDESGFVRWNRYNVFGSNFGLYQAILKRESDVLYSTYFSIFDTTIQGSVDWENDNYTIAERPALGYSIENGDLSTYTYTLKIVDSLQQIKESYTLNSYSGIKGPSLAGYSTGTYYAILSRTNKNTLKVDDFAFDTVEISAEGVDPSSYINFGSDTYTIGDSASYTFNWVDDDRSILRRELVVIIKDGVVLDRVNAGVSGIRYLDMDETGRYSISLISYGYLTYNNPIVHAADGADVFEPLDSFINVPSEFAVKKEFVVNYLYGSTPVSPVMNVKFLQNDYTYKIIDTQILPAASAGVSYSTHLSIDTVGYYVIDLYDNGVGRSFATDSIYTRYVYIPPTDIVLSSYISTDNTSYSMGGILSGSYAIDDSNYTDYHTKFEIYNVDKDIVSFSFEPLHQLDSFVIPFITDEIYNDGENVYPVSTNFLPGLNSVRLVSYDSSGIFNDVIVESNITLSITDTEGYGLTLSKYVVEENERFSIRAICPTSSNVTIHALSLMGVSDFVVQVDGSTQFAHAIGLSDTYLISLISNNEVKCTQIIKVLESSGIGIDPDDPIGTIDYPEGAVGSILTIIHLIFGDSKAGLFIAGSFIIALCTFGFASASAHIAGGIVGAILGLGIAVALGLISMIWAVLLVVLAGAVIAFTFKGGVG